MNLRQLFKRHLPERQRIAQHRHLNFLGERLHDPDLWHLSRRSAAGGVAVGVFMAFLPVPIQMLLAVLAAMALRVNLPLAVLFTWVSNPLTMPPMYLLGYKLGATLMGERIRPVHFELSLHWVNEVFVNIWEPLILGCVILGAIAALVANLVVRGLWRLHLVRAWQRRKRLRTRRPDSAADDSR